MTVCRRAAAPAATTHSPAACDETPGTLGSIKWWIVLLLLLFALALALPDEQTDRQLGRALRRMPVLFLLTAANLFRLRGTKDKFIHTEHTGAGGNAPGANTPTEP